MQRCHIVAKFRNTTKTLWLQLFVNAADAAQDLSSVAQQRSVAIEQTGLFHIEAVFGAHVTAQCVDAAVSSRTVGTEWALRSVRVIVVPPVGHLLAARLAPP